MLGLVGTAAVAGVAGQASPVAAAPSTEPTLDAGAIRGYWASVSRDENGQGSAPEGR